MDNSEHWPVDDDSLNHRICNDLGYPTKKLWDETDAGNWLVTTYVLVQIYQSTLNLTS
jgi:hypothetical protein